MSSPLWPRFSLLIEYTHRPERCTSGASCATLVHYVFIIFTFPVCCESCLAVWYCKIEFHSRMTQQSGPQRRSPVGWFAPSGLVLQFAWRHVVFALDLSFLPVWSTALCRGPGKRLRALNLSWHRYANLSWPASPAEGSLYWVGS